MSMERRAGADRLRGLSHSQYRVLQMLADHESKDGKCNPSIDLIAEECEMSRRYVQITLKELVLKNIIRIKYLKTSKNDNYTNEYTFLFPKVSLRGPRKKGVNHSSSPGGANHSSPPDEPQFARGANHSSSKPVISTSNSTSNSSPPPTVNTVPTVGGGGRDVNDHSQHGDADSSAPTEGCLNSVGGDRAGVVPTTTQGANCGSSPSTPSTTPSATSLCVNSTQPTRKFRQGLEWLADFETYSNPYAELTDKKNCMFMPAWDPEFPDDIWGCTLPEDEIDRINAEPIPYALAMIGETENVITKNALTKRMNWIGKNHFVGEVARMRSEQRDGTSKWENAGQILLRRLEYVYGEVIATDNHNHDFDVRKLWNFALAA